MDWQGKKVTIIGMARSGLAAAKVLHGLGATVTIADNKPADQLGEALKQVSDLTLAVVTGGYPPVARQYTDLVVTSPGVPLTILPLRQALEEGIPVWSELELAYLLARGPVVAITGTNGKTTTTALVGQMFKDAGRPVVVGGNIGVPLVLEAQRAGKGDVLVAEVSSFQLECTHQFRPRVAVILNITPDHLDRHGSMEEYKKAKAKIFRQQTGEDFTVLNYDDHEVRQLAEETPGRVIFFSRRHMLEEGVCLIGGEVTVRLGGKQVAVARPTDLLIRGSHNLENTLAAVAAGWVMHLPADAMAYTLRTFPGVAHRMELVRQMGGVRYINDSKGTNPDASIKALEAYDEPLILIAGGRNKGSDFSPFARAIKERVKELVLVGEAAPDIRAAVEAVGYNHIHQAATFPEAVYTAAGLAVPGDIVLLSPACASWDMFNNYEERGDTFRQLVSSLEPAPGSEAS